MQYTVLLVVSLIAVAIIVLLNLQSWFSIKRLAKARKDVDREKVFRDHFADFERVSFDETWNEIASVLGIPANKLSPTDTISDFVGTRHLPEPYLEKLEIYLVEKGLNPSEVNIGSPLKDVVRQILQRHKSH